MPGRRLPEPYSVSNFRSYVKDSLSYLGEQAILLSTYHVIPDEKTRPRCICYDPDYDQSAQFHCPNCYGTGFEGGVKQAVRVWAMFTDTTSTEALNEQGYWNPDKRQVQIEWFPPLMQGDYVVRIPPRAWINYATPSAIAGIYKIGEVASNSLRQGQVQGQTPEDLVGQKGTVQLIDEDMPIYGYEIVGKSFARLDGRKL